MPEPDATDSPRPRRRRRLGLSPRALMAIVLVGGVLGLKRLEYLDFDDAQVSDQGLAGSRAALPGLGLARTRPPTPAPARKTAAR